MGFYDLAPSAVGYDDYFSTYPATGVTIVGTDPLTSNDGDLTGVQWGTDFNGGIYIAFAPLPAGTSLDSSVNYFTPILTVEFVTDTSTASPLSLYTLPYRSLVYGFSQSGSWHSFPSTTTDVYVDSLPSNGGILLTDPLVVNDGLGPSSAYGYQPVGSNYVTRQDVLDGTVRVIVQASGSGYPGFRITRARLRVATTGPTIPDDGLPNVAQVASVLRARMGTPREG